MVVAQSPGHVVLLEPELKHVLGHGELVGAGVAIAVIATVGPAGDPCSSRCSA